MEFRVEWRKNEKGEGEKKIQRFAYVTLKMI